MKLSQVESPVEVIDAAETPTTFQIASSKEAFKILSSGLYNNKIRAIIRELSCNAYDAHVAAGKKDQPWDMHLPTRNEPYFSICDHGTGLRYIDPCPYCEGTCQTVSIIHGQEVVVPCGKCQGTGIYDEVKSLYTTYFGTNKTDSNEYIGALGLGSKSPFCYTDSKGEPIGFTVTNRKDGVKRVYSCYINEKGMPAVVRQTEEPTIEDNGLEVMFPVRVEDCYEFENQSNYVFEFFNPLPNCNRTINPKVQQYTIRTPKWGLRQDRYQFNGKIRAIQGLVPYVVGDIDKSRLTPEQAKVLELPIDLFFDIGDLSVAASRETLSNDDRTINNIIAALAGITDKFVENAKEQLKQVTTMWQARLKIFELINTPVIGSIINEALNKGVFDGIYQAFGELKAQAWMADQRVKVYQLDYPNLSFSRFSPMHYADNAKKTNLGQPNKKVLEAKQKIDGEFSKYDYTLKFEVEPRVMFIINDVGFGGERYIHYYLNHDNPNYEIKKVYYFNKGNKDSKLENVAGEAMAILKLMGNPPFKLLSELKETYKDRVPETTTEYQYVKKDLVSFNFQADISKRVESSQGGYNRAGWRNAWEKVELTDLDDEKKYYYVDLDKSRPVLGDFDFAQDFAEFVKKTYNADLMEELTIYGIPKDSKAHKLMKDNPDQWIEFFSHVEKEAIAKVDQRMITWLSFAQYRLDSGYETLLSHIGEKRVLSPASPIQKFANQYVAATQYDDIKVMSLLAVLKKLEEWKKYTVPLLTDFNPALEEVLKGYPMLKHVSLYSRRGQEQIKECVQYIKMVDSFQQEEARKKLELTAMQVQDVYSIKVQEEDSNAVN